MDRTTRNQPFVMTHEDCLISFKGELGQILQLVHKVMPEKTRQIKEFTAGILYDLIAVVMIGTEQDKEPFFRFLEDLDRFREGGTFQARATEFLNESKAP